MPINIINIKPETTNVGNDVIQQGLYGLLREGFDVPINIISVPACAKGNPGKNIGLSSASVYEINRIADGVIVGGGNLFENGELELDQNALQALEVPMLLFSMAWGRIYNREGKLVRRSDAMPEKKVIDLCARSTTVLARDEVTLAYLRELGVSNGELGGCPGFLLASSRSLLPQPTIDVSGTVLLSVRTPERMCVSPRLQAGIRSDILGMIEVLKECGYPDIRLLCHDYRDLFFASSFPDTDYIYTENATELLAMLARCRLNVGYRLHAFIPCVSFGTPSILITYDERAESVLETTGLGAWGINMMNHGCIHGQLREKLANLDDFAGSVNACRARISDYEQSMRTALHDFSKTVIANHRRHF